MIEQQITDSNIKHARFEKSVEIIDSAKINSYSELTQSYNTEDEMSQSSKASSLVQKENRLDRQFAVFLMKQDTEDERRKSEKKQEDLRLSINKTI